jgi:hypothetical protein
MYQGRDGTSRLSFAASFCAALLPALAARTVTAAFLFSSTTCITAQS